MRIEQRKALTVLEILAGEVGDQCGFSGTDFSHDVNMVPSVRALDAKPAAMIAEVGLGEEQDGVASWVEDHGGKLFKMRIPVGTRRKKAGEIP